MGAHIVTVHGVYISSHTRPFFAAYLDLLGRLAFLYIPYLKYGLHDIYKLTVQLWPNLLSGPVAEQIMKE